MPDDGEPGPSRSEPITTIAPAQSSQLPKSQSFSQWVRSFIGMKDSDSSLRDALQDVLDHHSDDVTKVSPEERRILSNLLDFGEVEVRDIMVPQSAIIAVEVESTLDEVRAVMIEERHTRLPVYEKNIDNVVGIIHVKDLVPLLGNGTEQFSMAEIMRKVLFVPPSMKISDLLLKMRIAGMHMAIVVDEYGGTSGLVTLEDLFEEIVGEIQDEHDEEEGEPLLQWDRNHCVVLEGLTRIERIEEDLGVVLSNEEEDDYDTVGGLIFAELGRVPAEGESVHLPQGIQLDILEADARRIIRVRMTRTEPVEYAANG